MNYSKEAGFGRIATSGLPFTGSGKVFVVGDSGTANLSMLHDLWKVDADGVSRFFSTIDAAINSCTASAGDVIFVMPGHTETLTSAGAIALDVAGVSIIGIGVGNNRPVLTFGTANTASMTISASNCRVENIVGYAGIDGLTSPFNVTGDNCYLDIEWQDASSTVEAATAVRLDTANNSFLRLKYLGFTGGNAAVRPVAVDDCDNVRIDIDGFGVVTTAWVNLVDVASTNVFVSGQLYTQAITNYTRNVVDTVTGSTWFAVLYDKSAGSYVIGSDVAAFADADVSSIAAAIAVIDGYHDVPTADATTNTVMRDVIGNKTDATVGAVTTNKSLMGYLKGVLEDTGTTLPALFTVPAADATTDANMRDVVGKKDDAAQETVGTTRSLMAYIKAILTDTGTTIPATLVQTPQIVSKTYADLTGYDDAVAFTVTGDVMVRVWGVVGGTAITTTSGTTTLSVGTTEAVAACLPATTVDNSDFAATDVWVDNNPEDDAGSVATTSQVIIGGGADISMFRSVDDITAGSLTLYCEWRPLSAGATVVAA